MKRCFLITLYPEFRAWVTSNGADNKDWYLHPAAEKVVEAW